jgi:hypothetical protein
LGDALNMNIKEIALELEKYDLIFLGNINDKIKEYNLNKKQVKELFKELNYYGFSISNKDKSFIYRCLED